MKKLFLLFAVAAFIVACTPKSQPAPPVVEDEVAVVDEVADEVVPDVPVTSTTKPAAKPTTPKAEEPKAEEPKVEEPKAEEPKADKPKENEQPTNKVKGRR
jgi:hypothetical protein